MTPKLKLAIAATLASWMSTHPSAASQWWILERGWDGASCFSYPSRTPTSTYNFLQRFDDRAPAGETTVLEHPLIVDKGDEVDVVSTSVTSRYFRTEGACMAVAKPYNDAADAARKAREAEKLKAQQYN
jgi:hypothetical protein